MDSKVLETVRAIAEVDDRLRGIFTEHFGIESSEDNGYKAYATLAVEVAVSIANIFLLVKGQATIGRAHRVVCDLVYRLNTNEFWTKNAGIIIPVMHAALNAHSDSEVFALDRKDQGTYALHDGLRYAAMLAPLEVFSTILFCISGDLAVKVQAPEMKLKLLQFFKV